MNAKEILKETIFRIVNGQLIMEVPNKQYYPYGTDEYQYPRTIKPVTSITSSRIITDVLDIDNFILNGTPVNNITWDKNEKDIMSLVTAKALNDNVKEIYNRIEEIDPNHVFYQDNSVITLPITDTTFSSGFWEYHNWDISRGEHAIYKSTGRLGDTVNYLTLKGHPFPRYGTYFINIEIENLDSGRLVVYDESGNELGSSIVPGRFGVSYTPISPESANIRIDARDVIENEYISISSVSIYFVTNRIREYLDYVVPTILSGGDGGFVSAGVLNRAIEEMKLYLNDEIAKLPNANSFVSLVGHVTDRTSNPHGITPEMIDAATANHTHDPAELFPPAAYESHTHLPIEISAADRDHTHQPEDVGAARVNHTHSPEECGAAPENHEHSQYLTLEDLEELNISGGTESSSTGSSLPAMTRVYGWHVNYPFSATTKPQVNKQLCYPREFCHVYENVYEPVMGYAYTNSNLKNGNDNAWQGFYTATKYNSEVFAIFDRDPTVTEPISLGYNFNVSKRINTYTVYRRDRDVYPKSWTITCDRGLLGVESNIHWNENEFSKTFSLLPDNSENVGSETINGTPVLNFKFTVTEVERVAVFPNVVPDTTVPFTIRLDMTFNRGMESVDLNTVLTILNGNNAVTMPTGKGVTIKHEFDNESSVFIKTEDLTNLNYFNKLYITAQLSGDDATYSYETFPPEYGYFRQGIPFFANKQIRNYYGSLSTLSDEEISSDDISDESDNITNIVIDPYADTVKFIYTYPTSYDDSNTVPNFVTEEGTNIITIYHRNIPKLNFLGWKCFLHNDAIRNNLAPTSLKIKYTRFESGYEPNATIPEKDKYLNQIVSGEIDELGIFTYTALFSDFDLFYRITNDASGIDDTNSYFKELPITNVTQLEYTFINNKGTKISLVGLCPYFSNEFYSISDNILYNSDNEIISKKTYIGICDILHKSNNDEVISYPHLHPLGTVVDLPLDVNITQYSTIYIPNMFFTKHLKITALDTDVKKIIDTINTNTEITSYITPSVKIKDITPETISMVVHGVRAIRIERLW